MLNVLHGRDSCQLSLIEDSTFDNRLTYSIFRELLKRREPRILVLCYKNSPKDYKNKLPNDERFLYFDGFTDHLNWSEQRKSLELLEDGLVVIDDVLLFGRSIGCIQHNGKWKGLIRRITTLTKNPVLMFIDSDLTDDFNTSSLKYMCNFHAEINSSHGDKFTCTSIFKKNSGKVQREVDLVQIIDDTLVVNKNKTDNNNAESQEADPSSNLTFNLRLSSAELESRKNLVLPYILSETNKQSALSGRVVYNADEADDIDEEDPDDDLDI